MMCASCASSRVVAVRPDLPPMPASVQVKCQQPDIAPIDGRILIARYIAAVRTCDGKRSDAVDFYKGLQKELGGRPHGRPAS
jgi:hypothetical protein